MRIALGNWMIGKALKLWRTDATFFQYPFGPPDHGIRYGLAWRLYHAGLSLKR